MARAEDGTIEAIELEGHHAWFLGVQWHPEYDWETDPVSRRIFEEFGAVVSARMNADRSAAAD